MVQIKIKAVNNAYFVHASFDDFDAFLGELKHKLETICLRTDWFEAFFDLPELSINNLSELFKCTQSMHCRILGVSRKSEKEIMIIEDGIHNGEIQNYKQDVLIIGDVAHQAYLSSDHNIYVVGSVYGKVDLLHTHCVLQASAIAANVRICDSAFHKMTAFATSKVYYENSEIKIKLYKEEKLWPKSL